MQPLKLLFSNLKVLSWVWERQLSNGESWRSVLQRYGTIIMYDAELGWTLGLPDKGTSFSKSIGPSTSLLSLILTFSLEFSPELSPFLLQNDVFSIPHFWPFLLLVVPLHWNVSWRTMWGFMIKNLTKLAANATTSKLYLWTLSR